MDLKALTPSSDTIKVNILHPVTNEPFLNDDQTPMWIEVYAPHTKNYKSGIYRQASARMKVGKVEDEIDFETLDTASIEFLASITKGWSVTFGGEMPELTPAKAQEVYSEIFWLKSQVEQEINNFEVFIVT